MSNIQDVARHAGVSASTVSNALNRRTHRMGKETLARVEAAIAALGFVPNRAARQLKTGHTPLIGLLVPSIANPMYGAVAREIEAAAQRRHGFRVLLGSTDRDAAQESRFFDDLLAHGVRGVVIVSSLADERHVEAAVERGLVVVSYDRRATPAGASRVDHFSVDNVEAARLATAHLLALGHRRIALATVSGRTMSRCDKIDGFLGAARAAGLGDAARVLEAPTASAYGDAEMSDAGRALALRLAGDAARPTAVIAINDMLALGLMAGLRETALAVPGDVSVVGMDDLFLSALSNPALTTVRLPLREMAEGVVSRLIARLGDSALAPGEFIFQPELVARQSVAAASLRAPEPARPGPPT
jgi:DNA-binding LacI/PurR family transcriptional regulator